MNAYPVNMTTIFVSYSVSYFLLNETDYSLLTLWVNTTLCYPMSTFFLFFRYTDNLIDVLLSREGELPYTYLKQTIVHIE